MPKMNSASLNQFVSKFKAKERDLAAGQDVEVSNKIEFMEPIPKNEQYGLGRDLFLDVANAFGPALKQMGFNKDDFETAIVELNWISDTVFELTVDTRYIGEDDYPNQKLPKFKSASRDELSSKKAELKRVTAEYEKTIDKVDDLAKKASALYDEDWREHYSRQLEIEEELENPSGKEDRDKLMEELEEVEARAKEIYEDVESMKKESQKLYDGKGRDLYKKMIQLEDEIDQLEAAGSTKSAKREGPFTSEHRNKLDSALKDFKSSGSEQKVRLVISKNGEMPAGKWRTTTMTFANYAENEMKKLIRLNGMDLYDVRFGFNPDPYGANPFALDVTIMPNKNPEPSKSTKSTSIEFSEAIRAKMIKFAQAVAEQLNGDDPLEQFGVEIPVRGRQSGKDWFTNIKQVERSAAAELKSIAPKGLVYSIDFKVESLSEPHGTLSISATRGPSDMNEPEWIKAALKQLENMEQELDFVKFTVKQSEDQIEADKKLLKLHESERAEAAKKQKTLETAIEMIQQELKKAGRSAKRTKPNQSQIKQLANAVAKESDELKENGKVVVDGVVRLDDLPEGDEADQAIKDTELMTRMEVNEATKQALKAKGFKPIDLEISVKAKWIGKGFDCVVTVKYFGEPDDELDDGGIDEDRSAKRAEGSGMWSLSGENSLLQKAQKLFSDLADPNNSKRSGYVYSFIKFDESVAGREFKELKNVTNVFTKGFTRRVKEIAKTSGINRYDLSVSTNIEQGGKEFYAEVNVQVIVKS